MRRLAVLLRSHVTRLVPRGSLLPALALAAALVSALPRLAVAQGATEVGKMCYEAMDAYYASCQDYGSLAEVACEWLVGWGYVACVLIDTIVLIAQSLPSPF